MTDYKKLIGIDMDAADKREVFIHATIDCLVDHGYAGTTVRKIANYANVTPGLLTHYFKGKEDLIAETYLYVSRNIMAGISERVNQDQSDPVEAFKVYIHSRIESETLDPKLLKVWLTFWTLTLTQPDLKHVHREVNSEYIKIHTTFLENILAAQGKKADSAQVKKIAIGIQSLLDGMWLEWCLDPSSFFSEEGFNMIADYVEGVSGLTIRS